MRKKALSVSIAKCAPSHGRPNGNVTAEAAERPSNTLSPAPPNYRLSLLVLETALIGAVGAAAAWAVYHPSRSIQDRLAGTWIVPR